MTAKVLAALFENDLSKLVVLVCAKCPHSTSAESLISALAAMDDPAAYAHPKVDA